LESKRYRSLAIFISCRDVSHGRIKKESPVSGFDPDSGGRKNDLSRSIKKEIKKDINQIK
jgi:hypothetical protein